MSARTSFAWIGGLALAVLALHLATNGQYDFHRDSLYDMDSARHPAWGYVDYPPVTPTIARFSLWLFGPSVWGLRLWPTLAGSLMVILSALIARELGGGRFAQVLAAVGAAASPVLLGANWLFQTVTFDQLIWVVCFWLATRLIRTGDRRLWIALGIALGVGFETKYTIMALAAGIAAGTVLTGERRHLRTPWPWLGVAAALLIFLPNLIWQAANDWPSVQYTFNHKSAQSVDFSPLTFLAEQLALIGPLALPFWLAGWYHMFSSPRRRLIGVAAAVPFVTFLFAGKSYYIGPLHPVLLAAGACALESWTTTHAGRLRPSAAAALILQAVVLLPLTLPVLPEGTMARSPLAAARKDFADTVGWHELVAQVAAIFDALPPEQRAIAVIITDNYGEAGAINTYGPAMGLPTALSGELTYYYWKPAHLPNGPVVAVGIDPGFLAPWFADCKVVATIANSYSLHNEEYGAPISVCHDAKVPLDELWPHFKAFH